MPLDKHPLVCCCIDTAAIAAAQGSALLQTAEEFNTNIVHYYIVFQNTVKKYESSTLLNTEESMLSFSFLKKISPSGV